MSGSVREETNLIGGGSDRGVSWLRFQLEVTICADSSRLVRSPKVAWRVALPSYTVRTLVLSRLSVM